MSQHLGDWEAAAYVDGRLSAEARTRVEDHLEACLACRTEVVDVARALDRNPALNATRPRRRVSLSGLGLAAAAALAVVLLRQPPSTGSVQEQQRELSADSGTEGVRALVVVQPAPGATIAAGDRQFVWRAAGTDATYQVTVGDAAGRILWRATTGDTTLTLPAAIMHVGEMYFWHVDALLPTGISATTRAQGFTVRRP